MSNNESPQDFIENLPVASTVERDISQGKASLPPTALLGEAERRRLEKLAESGEQPVEPSKPDKSEDITCFSDGSVVKYLPRPGSTQCVIVEATGKHLAITKDANIADWICNACNLMVFASAKAEIEGRPLQIFHTPVALPEK